MNNEQYITQERLSTGARRSVENTRHERLAHERFCRFRNK